jgi:hypothetical protein
VLRTVYDEASDQAAGTVVRTDPPAGAKIDAKGGVSLVLAVPRESDPIVADPSPGMVPPLPASPPAGGGPRPGLPGSTTPVRRLRSVPNLYGVDSATARRRLVHAGLVVGAVVEEASDRRPGSILRTIPAAGTSVAAGSRVDLVMVRPSPVRLGVGRVDPHSEYASCATGYRFEFSQQVSMTEPGRVPYRWRRSDGASAPVEYLDFSAPGTQIAVTWWQRGGNAGDRLEGWEQIEILKPTELLGERITFTYVCPAG